jgi:homoserine kinase
MMAPVRAFAPGTVANVAAAFDVLGFALSAPGDTVEVAHSERPGVHLVEVRGDHGVLPRDPAKNTATVAVSAMLAELGSGRGLEVRLDKGLPLCSGLGSSAASSAAAVLAANQLLGEPLSRRQLLPFVVTAEATACGTAHADNAAPALLGGFTLIRSTSPFDIVSLPIPDDLCCVLVHPHCEVRTEDARKVLRSRVTLAAAVEQWANVAGLIAGLCTGDLDLIGRSLRDGLIEPTRSLLIPGFAEVKEAALGAGALGCSISGSGPTVFALCHDLQIATAAGQAMADAFAGAGLSSDVYSSRIDRRGARIVAG